MGESDGIFLTNYSVHKSTVYSRSVLMMLVLCCRTKISLTLVFSKTTGAVKVARKSLVVTARCHI